MHQEPTRDEIDAMPGPVVLEFGATWCGHCIALRPHIDAHLARFANFKHIAVEDGKGRPLGRSFRVKLWPTLVFLHNGQVVDRLVRPHPDELQPAFESLAAAANTTP